MVPQSISFPGDKYKNIILFGFFVMIAVYLADCFTPLRLHVDSIRYYNIKDCLEFGCDPNSYAAKDYFPIGYTALLFILSKLGILKSFSVVFINDIFLLAGLYLLYKVFAKTVPLFLLCLIVLLNWLFIKFVAHPLSEMQYIFFSLTSIFFYSRFTQQKNIYHLLLAILFGWLAFITRSVGISLMGALAVALIWEFRNQQLNFFRKNKLLVISILIVLAGALVVFSKQLGINHYGNVLSEHFKEAPLFKRIGWRFKEWGEIFVNTPSNKVIDRLAGRFGEIAFMGIGLVIFSWFIYVLFLRRTGIPFFIKAYMVFYCIIMFNWPFNDPRFWVPVMPLMAAITIHGIAYFKENRIIKSLSSILFVIYIMLGAFAAGYMVYSSFNKEFFSRNQAKGVYRNEYEVHFFGKPQSDTAKTVDPSIVNLLKRYD
jgi:hypothetical protein